MDDLTGSVLRGAYCVLALVKVIGLRLTKCALRITQYALLFALLAACAETPQVTRPPVHLRLADAAEHTNVLERLITAYTHDHDWITITIEPMPAETAIAQVSHGQTDLAVLPTAPDQNRNKVWVSGWAYDSLAIIVNVANPASNVSLAQLRDLFQGRTFDWTPFGGSGDVIPVSREASAQARVLFEERVMGNRAVTLNAVLESSARDVIDFVARTPTAIGYVSISQVDARVKALNIEGILPDATSSASGQYALSTPNYLVAQSEPQDDLRDFVIWLLGNDGQSQLSQMGLGRVR